MSSSVLVEGACDVPAIDRVETVYIAPIGVLTQDQVGGTGIDRNFNFFDPRSRFELNPRMKLSVLLFVQTASSDYLFS